MDNRYHKFNVLFITIVIVVMLIVPVVNYILDPYGIYQSPQFDRVNRIKPEKMTQERLTKAYEVIHKKPSVIFLGSSRVATGLDPQTYKELRGEEAYNLGLSGANTYEQYRYFRHALYNQPNLKTVIVGLDFPSFNKYAVNRPDFREHRLERSSPSQEDVIETLLSLSALNMGIKTFSTNITKSNPSIETSDGSISEEKQRIHFAGRSRKDEFFKMLPGHFLQLRDRFEYSDDRMNDVRQIAQTCKDRNITLILFISPIHAALQENLSAAGRYSEFEEWKRKLVKIAPVWDFSGFNTVTTEPVTDEMKYYWEATHYQKRAGNLVLYRILNTKVEEVPTDFGVLLTSENIDKHLAKTRRDHEQWKKQNPEFIEQLARIHSRT